MSEFPSLLDGKARECYNSLMRVQVHPADTGGCGNYRMTWPAQALINQGHDVVIKEPDTPEADLQAIMQVDPEGTEHVVGLAEKPDADVIVLQRPLSYQLVEMIYHLRKAGMVVIVEIDDDFQNIHPQNVAWKLSHPTYNPKRNWKWLQQACAVASGVTVSTPALQHYRADAAVLPNHVPEWYTTVPIHDAANPATIGWSGSLDTHPQDLQETNGAVPRMVHNGHRIKIVGTGKGVHRAFGLGESVDLQATDWVSIEHYPLEMSTIDVGLVPLKANKFNDAKSYLKGLEWAALGVPFVASPTTEYLHLSNQYGIGHIALKAKHWPGLVRSFTQDDRQLYRDRVLQNDLVIERRASDWWDAWKTIADRSAT